VPTPVDGVHPTSPRRKRGVVYLISRLILRPLFLLVFRPHVVGR